MKKKMAWVLVIILAGGLFFNSHRQSPKDEERSTEEIIAAGAKVIASSRPDLVANDKFKHHFYLSSICNLRKDAQDLNFYSKEIAAKRSIPSDYNEIFYQFAASVHFISTFSTDSLIRNGGGFKPEELPIRDSISKLADEIAVKNEELKQGKITSQAPYFLTINKVVYSATELACQQDAQNNPAPAQILKNTSTQESGFDLQATGRDIAYSALCKVTESWQDTKVALLNANKNSIFKNALLDQLKIFIFDLGMAAYYFDGNLIWTEQTSDEDTIGETLSNYKSKAELTRYRYWANPSKNNLTAVEKLGGEVSTLTENLCATKK